MVIVSKIIGNLVSLTCFISIDILITEPVSQTFISLASTPTIKSWTVQKQDNYWKYIANVLNLPNQW